jgi:hypothetical protein
MLRFAMSFRTIRKLIAVAILGSASLVCAQTTQGLISGRLLNSVTGRAIGGASIVAIGAGTSEARTSSDASGYFYLPLLSPATYRVQVTQTGFQSQEIQELTLAVAARLELDFLLRPLSDVWEAGQYNSVFLPGSKTIVTFFGPDVDPSRSGSFEAQKGRAGALESTVSNVIDSAQLQGLPLLGRDVYTMLATEPGVTSDSATGRGLGLSINGQRPSASNFLMDGLENNNYLITGPLVTVAPEAVQEYRVSTNNFSAEYGRTSGFLANTITRAGTNQFHGTGYFYLKNDVLNANGFQENFHGFARRPDKEIQPGFVLGGPILKNRLFFSSSYEYFSSHSFGDPAQFVLPNVAELFFALSVPKTNRSYDLLTRFPPPVPSVQAVGQPITIAATIAPPVDLERHLGVERLDHSSPDGKNRFMGRLLVSRVTEPDFIWTPYPDFISPLHQNSYALGGSYLRLIRSDLTNEARLSASSDHLSWDRPHSEIPTLSSGDGVILPGSPAFYAYKNVNNSQELLDNLIWTKGRHLVTAGVGVLFRTSDGYLTAGENAQYGFNSVVTFAQDRPVNFRVSLSRALAPALVLPDSHRSYSYRQYFGFVQDTFRVTRRLTANYGLRYEYYGGPSNTGAVKDTQIQLGSGANLAQQLIGASLFTPSGGGNQQLFSADPGDIAVRAGISYDLTGSARTLLRGAYGIFYDRPFDNLWENLRNNNFILPSFNLQPNKAPQPPVFDVLTPISTVLTGLAGSPVPNQFPEMTMVNPDLKNGRVYSYFAGVQHRFSDSLTTEVNALGSYGRRLITTDIINRDFSVPAGTYVTSLGRYTGVAPNIDYRNSDGTSDYNALTALVRYRSARGFLQASYTWSHTIDVQSDALAGDFFNLSFSAIASSSGTSGRATYARQFDPNSDRGDADFDQRHNFVLQSYWNPPPLFSRSQARWLLRDWNVGALLAIRSGFPYSLLGTSTKIDGGGLIESNRPDLINPAIAKEYQPGAGGVQLLNPAAFVDAAPSTLGNVGRNAFIGPGFYNLDLAVGRSFPLPWLGEGSRLNFRADFFNVLNHANLGNPDTLLGSLTTPNADFGFATFGRQASQGSGFPTLAPLNETPRQIQLSVRIQF